MSLFYPLLTLIAVPIERAWIMFVLGSYIIVHKSLYIVHAFLSSINLSYVQMLA